MKKNPKQHGELAQQVAEGTQQYLRDVQTENERLRSLLESARTEKLRVEKFLAEMKTEMETHYQQQAKLQEQLADIELENRRFSEQFVHLERQSTNLSRLYVATYRLHETLDRQEVLLVIEEIVNAILGSEQFAIFELDPRGAALRLVKSAGLEGSSIDSIPVGRGHIGQVALTGETFVGDGGKAGGEPHEAGLTACVPLRLGDKIIGAIAIFELLPQKPAYEAADREVFELLATQAAMALYCTKLHVQASA